MAALSKPEVEKRVRDVIRRIGIARTGAPLIVLPGDLLRDDLKIIDQERVELKAALEIAVSMEIDEQEFEACMTVADVIELVSHSLKWSN